MDRPPDLGFETIGNATLVVHDREPVLATDPWIEGSAYFGSWGLSHPVPPTQAAAVRAAGAVWFSHGHPDHLNPASLPLFRDTRILLPDHVGGRIASDLTRDGYRVEVLPDATWVRISDRVRVLCITDEGQDAVLLVDVGGELVVNLNDAQDRGWGPLVKRVIRAFPRSFLLRLSGYGDADMINFVDDDGSPVPSVAQLRKESGFEVGADVARMTETFGATHFVPFSSFHRYQRTDSEWANQWTTPVAEYERGFHSDRVALLPAFVRYDVASGSWEAIDPPAAPALAFAPEKFGDDWSERLEPDDVDALRRYFTGIQRLARHLDRIVFRVGGEEHAIDLGGRDTGRSVTFAVPRASLVRAVEWEIFDDLLIGNYMTAALHGPWPSSRLYPGFTPWVTKYADNGRARTDAELRAYFAEYRRRLGITAWLRSSLEQRAKDTVRTRLSADSPVYEKARQVYARAKGAG
ncbi:MAG TPA: MBL fold metallo-hydrolase [Acidimicrobiia bacterium]